VSTGRNAIPGALLGAFALGCWTAPALLRSRHLRGAVFPAMAGRGASGSVALTFDDGPDPRGTPAVLDALDRLGWRATFFMLGSQVRRYPELAARVVDAGHEAAVHGYAHRNHLARGPVDLDRDVTGAAELIQQATGTRPRWFRPPYGVLTLGSLAAARRAGLSPVLWTAWGRDWTDASAGQVAAIVGSQLRPGGTVLLHDSDCAAEVAGSWRATVAALPLLAEVADRLECTVVPLREHMNSAT
jgi:peptidoglycan/xylan/chitin deacetylase (PgdA/CDA1 family)